MVQLQEETVIIYSNTHIPQHFCQKEKFKATTTKVKHTHHTYIYILGFIICDMCLDGKMLGTTNSCTLHKIKTKILRSLIYFLPLLCILYMYTCNDKRQHVHLPSRPFPFSFFSSFPLPFFFFTVFLKVSHFTQRSWSFQSSGVLFDI